MKLPEKGAYSTPEADWAMHGLFTTLRERWMAKYEDSSAALAQRLGVLPQSVAQWATGSDPTKKPPIWAVVAVADDIRVGLHFSGAGVEIVRRRKKPQ